MARSLAASGWAILGRNVRVGRRELDIVARDPLEPGVLVIVEVRSRSWAAFGASQESVDGPKVGRLYAAAWELARAGRLPGGGPLPSGGVRVDLICAERHGVSDRWRISGHLRGLLPP